MRGITYPKSTAENSINVLSEFTFGLVLGTANLPFIESNLKIHKEYVNKNEQNLDTLFNNRIDFTIMNKFAAANIMVEQKPHLIGKAIYLNPSLDKQPLYIAFSKKNKNAQAMLEIFNRGLKNLKLQASSKSLWLQKVFTRAKITQMEKFISP